MGNRAVFVCKRKNGGHSMLAKINRASDWECEEQKEVFTLEELKKISKENGNHSLIIKFPSENDRHDCDVMITIYDDYVE